MRGWGSGYKDSARGEGVGVIGSTVIGLHEDGVAVGDGENDSASSGASVIHRSDFWQYPLLEMNIIDIKDRMVIW